MTPEIEPTPLPATAPWLLHSLRTVFDSKQHVLLAEARGICTRMQGDEAKVIFLHRCMEVTALYHRPSDRFIELRACDIGETGWQQPSYSITMQLMQNSD